MNNTDWRKDCFNLWQQGKSWNEITEIIQGGYFNNEPFPAIRERVRGYIRSTPEYKQANSKPAVEQPKHLMAEVNIADLHLGKLCWHGDTPDNYDYKIARDMYYSIIKEVCKELKGRPIEYITFVWTNDFFNSDNEQKTTTGGTPQETDIREKKLYNVGCEMLVNGTSMLLGVAPVKTFYTPSNHDEQSSYHALKHLEAYYHDNPRLEINSDAYPRKYQLYGNTLIGYCHGQKENSRATKEKASRLASLMPLEAKELWGQAKYYEMHAAHLHSEQMIQEINGVIVRRIASPTAADTWHTSGGWMGAVRKAQAFIYDREQGLKYTINIPVM